MKIVDHFLLDINIQQNLPVGRFNVCSLKNKMEMFITYLKETRTESVKKWHLVAFDGINFHLFTFVHFYSRTYLIKSANFLMKIAFQLKKVWNRCLLLHTLYYVKGEILSIYYTVECVLKMPHITETKPYICEIIWDII